MQILKYQKLKNNKYKLVLDNDEEITLYDDVILNNSLLLSKEINDKEKLLLENSYYEAYYLCLKYIEKKLRTEYEIINYIKDKYDKKIINKVITKLKENHYIDDELYTKSYINDKINLTNDGYYKILRDLKNKQIDEYIIKNYLDEIDNNIWKDKINKITNKYIKNNTKYSSNYLKEKMLFELQNKGYDKSMILDIVNNIYIDENDVILEKNYNELYNKLSKKYHGKDLELQLLSKLLSKGFNYNKIKEIIKKTVD